MFEELGLNVLPQPDNGARPRPDNRSGWLEGETPDVVGELLAGDGGPRAGDGGGPLEVRLWDPASQLRFRPKKAVPPRPDGAPNGGLGRETREAAARRAAADEVAA